MNQLNAWHVTSKGTRELTIARIIHEEELEKWIEQEPDLVEKGLLIIGRQIRLPHGQVDLLALDRNGILVIIEVKKGPIRRDSILQAVDYLASIQETMQYEELSKRVSLYLRRKKIDRSLQELIGERRGRRVLSPLPSIVRVLAVGTDAQANIEQIIEFLRERGVTVSVVSLRVFSVKGAEQIVIRELSEFESQSPASKVETLLAMADLNGVGQEFRIIDKTAERHGLYRRLWPKSIM
ncbi:MAG: DUF91 domain-containing protein [Chloroflexi bacterium]|nr:DUF91 domain-containing protein [Chloroflexota bacterium]